jgi:hypothetical protein
LLLSLPPQAYSVTAAAAAETATIKVRRYISETPDIVRY